MKVAVGSVIVIGGVAIVVVSPEAAAAVNGLLIGHDAKGMLVDQNRSDCYWLALDLVGLGIGEYAAKGLRAFKLSGPNTLPIERQVSAFIASGWNGCLDHCSEVLDWASISGWIWETTIALREP